MSPLSCRVMCSTNYWTRFWSRMLQFFCLMSSGPIKVWPLYCSNSISRCAYQLLIGNWPQRWNEKLTNTISCISCVVLYKWPQCKHSRSDTTRIECQRFLSNKAKITKRASENWSLLYFHCCTPEVFPMPKLKAFNDIVLWYLWYPSDRMTDEVRTIKTEYFHFVCFEKKRY